MFIRPRATKFGTLTYRGRGRFLRDWPTKSYQKPVPYLVTLLPLQGISCSYVKASRPEFWPRPRPRHWPRAFGFGLASALLTWSRKCAIQIQYKIIMVVSISWLYHCNIHHKDMIRHSNVGHKFIYMLLTLSPCVIQYLHVAGLDLGSAFWPRLTSLISCSPHFWLWFSNWTNYFPTCVRPLQAAAGVAWHWKCALHTELPNLAAKPITRGGIALWGIDHVTPTHDVPPWIIILGLLTHCRRHALSRGALLVENCSSAFGDRYNNWTLPATVI